MRIKRIGVISIIVLSLVSLSACGGKNNDTSASPKEEVSTEISESISETSEDDKTGNEVNDNEASYEMSSYTYSGFYKSLIIPDAKDGIEIIDLGEAIDGYIAGEFCGYEDGYVIYRSYETSGESVYGSSLVRLSLTDKSKKVIYESDDFFNVDVYKGIIYINAKREDNEFANEEIAFSLESLEEVSVDKEYMSLIKNASISPDGTEKSSYSYLCSERARDIGRAIVNIDGVYNEYDGKELKALDVADNGNVVAYDAEKIVYQVVDEETYEKYTLFMKYGDAEPIKLSDNEYSFLGFRDKVLYWSERDDSVYGLPKSLIYSYDTTNNEMQLVTQFERQPGSGELFFGGTEGFGLIDGNIYLVADNTPSKMWVKLGKNADGTYSAPEAIASDLATLAINSYGEVKYYNKVSKCEFCNKAILEMYEEYFVMAPTVSEHADEINAELEKAAKANADNSEPSYAGETSEACETHKESFARETSDFYVTSADFISDSLFTINMSGYWYGGGAHGLPLTQQYLVDVKSGKFLSLFELYDGSLADFNALIATKTADDYERYEGDGIEYSPYFSASYEAVYDDAMNAVGYGDYNIRFEKDMLYIVYPPYAMGPYAAGYIEIPVSYEEFGITLY